MSEAITLPTDYLLQTSDVEAPPDLRRRPSVPLKVTGPPDARMPVEDIRVSENGNHECGNLDGLIASIQTRGVLEPLIITPDGRLLAGRRRLEAARRAGLATVPVRFCEIASERAAIEIGLVENAERADLDSLTRAKSYRGLLEQGATVEEIASLVGQGVGHVYQHLALLDLHPLVQDALHARALSFADARTFAPLELDDQAALLKEIQESPKPLSSRQVKARVEAHRIIRLVQSAQPEKQQDVGEPGGNYAALFEPEDKNCDFAATETQLNPLDEMNMIIAEMVAVAQGEDQPRAWARRLSQVLGKLQRMRFNGQAENNDPSPAQDRLL